MLRSRHFPIMVALRDSTVSPTWPNVYDRLRRICRDGVRRAQRAVPRPRRGEAGPRDPATRRRAVDRRGSCTDSRHRHLHWQVAADYADVSRHCPDGSHAVFLEAERRHHREAEWWD